MPTPKLLVIDDESDQCASLESYFGKRGFAVLTVNNGKAGLSLIKDEKPDVVILDLKLAPPLDNGKVVLQELRRFDQETKVIVITGYPFADETELKELQSLGISDFLTKPIGLEKLETIITNLLKGKIPKRPALKPTSPKPKPIPKDFDESLRPLIHDLTNILGIIRTKAEEYQLNMEEGIYKSKSKEELTQLSLEVMQTVIKSIDRASEITQTLSKIIKKQK
jgi:DNA-binding response OmpR family regulator